MQKSFLVQKVYLVLQNIFNQKNYNNGNNKRNIT